MTHKNFTAVASGVFGIVAIAHILRLINGWDVIIGSFRVPLWYSAVAALLAGYLSYQGMRLNK